jgi:hypothetical protein
MPNPENSEDREIQSLVMQAGAIRTDSKELREAIYEFRDTLRRGLIRSSFQGIAMIVVGIMLAITFLGLLSQTYTCDATNLAKQKGSAHYKVCAVVFPQIIPQVSNLQRAAAAAKVQAEERQAILRERIDIAEALVKTNAYLDTIPKQITCVLLIQPPDRTDANVAACLGVAEK